MVCDICHKQEASVHLTEIIDNQITELHLCEECARQKGAQMEQHFGLADLLAGLADLGQQFEVVGKTESKCPNCGEKFDRSKPMVVGDKDYDPEKQRALRELQKKRSRRRRR